MGERLAFSGENRGEKAARQMLNEKLFSKDSEINFTIKGSGVVPDKSLLRFPEEMVGACGYEEGLAACNGKLHGAKVATREENDERYNYVNKQFLDAEDEAYKRGKSAASLDEKNWWNAEEERAGILRETLDSLLEGVQDYGDGEVQSLESVANHRIANETKMMVVMTGVGSITEERRERYAERVTALAEVRAMLRYAELMKEKILHKTGPSIEEQEQVQEQEMEMEM